MSRVKSTYDRICDVDVFFKKIQAASGSNRNYWLQQELSRLFERAGVGATHRSIEGRRVVSSNDVAESIMD